MVSGIYIVSVKVVRGKMEEKPAKKTFSQKLRDKQKKYQKMYDEDMSKSNLSKEEKAAAKQRQFQQTLSASQRLKKKEPTRFRKCNHHIINHNYALYITHKYGI